jgi:hypothetical protein
MNKKDKNKKCLSPTSFSDFTGDSVVSKNKIWDKNKILKVGFLNGTDLQKQKVQKTIEEKLIPFISLKFEWNTNVHQSEIRIGFDKNEGAWSYVGIENLNIESPRKTMNLEWQDESVILHEFMHSIGFEHEMGNPLGKPIQWNKEKVYEDMAKPPNNWDRERVDSNIFIRLDPDNISGTDFDKDSIMLYPVPAEWTLDGFYSMHNKELSELDKKKLQETYPKENQSLPVYNLFTGQNVIVASDDQTSMKNILRSVFPNKIYVQRLWTSNLISLANTLGGSFDQQTPKHVLYSFIYDKLEI